MGNQQVRGVGVAKCLDGSPVSLSLSRAHALVLFNDVVVQAIVLFVDAACHVC